jgi:hypothetical protein
LDERKTNTRDEYSRIIGKFGNPDSIISAENDSLKPAVASRIARYDSAHVKIVFIPIGCLEAVKRASAIVADGSEYPALAENSAGRFGKCTPSSNGWMVVGYIDSSNNSELSAGLAEIFFDHRTRK